MTNEDFMKAVSEYIEVHGVDRLSERFECMRATPARWISGTARPHPLLMLSIVEWIKSQES